ncbi:MAG: hypothetical protein JWM88_3453 [Verrucomicrobia bacterium]|nr:hypothetical protein [Verrucomicrobiota bacterium]
MRIKNTLSPQTDDVQADPKAGNDGSALLATLCFAAVLSLSLSSYLAVCYRSLYLSNRDMQVTRSIELAEMGIEEALWALSNGNWTGWSTAGSTATKTLLGPGNFENNVTNRIQLTITNYNLPTSSFTSTSTPAITMTAMGRVILPDGTTISRTLQSLARPAQVFTNAIGATGTLSFASGGFVDSYDSSAGSYSYSATLSAGNSAAVISGSTISLQNAQVFGFASTTSNVSTPFQNGSSGKVVGPGTAAGTNIDSTRVSTAGNQPVFDLVVPSGGTTIYDPNNGNAVISHSMAINTSGVYRLTAMDLGGPDTISINAANVVLVVSDYVKLGGNSKIQVASGASLQLYVETNPSSSHRQLDIGGNGIINVSQLPQNVSIVGLGTRTTSGLNSQITTDVAFYGSIYLPNDNIDISDNGFTAFGALVGKNIGFSGTGPSIHFDKALLRIAPSGVNTPFSLVWLHEV